MAIVNIYLTFKAGNCEAAFNYYQAVFVTKVTVVNRFAEMPPSDHFVILEEEKNRIMHATLPISKETNIMGSDVLSTHPHEIIIGNNFSISVAPDNRESADAMFAKLSEGGQVTMPMQDTFWGAYFGSCMDQFGINWMINFGTGEMPS